MEQYHGQLSKEDIIRELKADPSQPNRLIISSSDCRPESARDFAPENDPRIKTASFDISPSCLIMSVKRGSFLRIYSSMSQCEKGHRNPQWHCTACKKRTSGSPTCCEQLYTFIPPRDTALVLSREYLQIPAYMSGNVYSRVSTVSSGLGHISTTIDPLWKGALLIAISNPSSEPIKLMLQDAPGKSIPLATVTLQYLNSPVDPETANSSHLPARVDILERYLYDESESKSIRILTKNFWHRLWHMKDYHLTVRLVTQLKETANIQPEQWSELLEKLERAVKAQKIRRSRGRSFLKWLIRQAGKLMIILAIAAAAYFLYPKLAPAGASQPDFLMLILVEILASILAMITK